MDFLAVYNPTEEEVTTTIHGSFFTWKPGQVKQMRASMAQFVDTNRQDLGLVKIEDPRFIPAEQDRYVPGFEKSDEGKKYLEPFRVKGINNLIKALSETIRNNQICLRQDLANKWPTGDSKQMAAAQASEGELRAMRMVKKYKSKTLDNVAKQIDEVETLMDTIGRPSA